MPGPIKRTHEAVTANAIDLATDWLAVNPDQPVNIAIRDLDTMDMTIVVEIKLADQRDGADPSNELIAVVQQYQQSDLLSGSLARRYLPDEQCEVRARVAAYTGGMARVRVGKG